MYHSCARPVFGAAASCSPLSSGALCCRYSAQRPSRVVQTAQSRGTKWKSSVFNAGIVGRRKTPRSLNITTVLVHDGSRDCLGCGKSLELTKSNGRLSQLERLFHAITCPWQPVLHIPYSVVPATTSTCNRRRLRVPHRFCLPQCQALFH